MPYIPKDYWLDEGKSYFNKFKYDKNFKLQEQIFINYLKELTFTSVLELGCGFGRITKLILNNFPGIQKYVGVDISPHQIENAKNYLKSTNNSQIVNFIVSDIQSLSINDQFDLVLASEVLLHVLPSEIKMVMEKMKQLSKLHIINIDWYEENLPEVVAEHNFVHSYEDIYKSMSGVKNVKRIPLIKKGLLSTIDTKQSIFHATI